MKTRFRVVSPIAMFVALTGTAYADTVLETETAELGKQGDWLVSQSIQYERAPDGHSFATVTQFEYGVTDRAEILIEPFFQEWDHPKDGDAFHGMGDLEITPSYMVVLEGDAMPAIVLAMKLKVPTAKNRDIGTGKTDFQPYVIIGKHFGEWTLNANFGVDLVGRVPGADLRDQFIWDFSVQRTLTENLSVFAEMFGNSSPAIGEKGTVAGAVAMEYQLGKHCNVFLSVGYDSDKVVTLRPGFNVFF